MIPIILISGNTIATASVAPDEATWKVPWAKNQDWLSESRSTGHDEAGDAVAVVSPWSATALLWSDLFRRIGMSFSAVVDLHALDAPLSTCCFTNKLAYIGLCHGTTHVEAMKKQCISIMWSNAVEDKDELKKLISKDAPDDEEDGQPGQEKKKRKGGKGKTKGKDKGSKNKKSRKNAPEDVDGGDKADDDEDEINDDEDDDGELVF